MVHGYHGNSLILYFSFINSWFKSMKTGILGHLLKNWMFNFVSLSKYKRQMTGNKLCKPAQRSGAGLHIICYPSSDIFYFNKLTKLNIQFL